AHRSRATGLLVLLRPGARLLPLHQGMSGRLATRACRAAARVRSVLALGVVVLAGCASVPNSPGVMVLPGTGKSFDQFRVDDAVCRQFAYEQVGGKTAERAQTESG